MKHSKRWMFIGWVMAIICLCMTVSCNKKGNDSGATAVTFNRRFLPVIKPAMTYEQIAQIAGGAGAMVQENRNVSPPTVQYRWKGGKESVLTVNFGNNKMIDATVLAPNGRTYLVRNNGEIADITK